MLVTLLLLIFAPNLCHAQKLPAVKVVPAAQVIEVPHIQIYEKTAKILFYVDLRETLKHVRKNASDMFMANETLLDLLKDDVTENILQSTHSTWLRSDAEPQPRNKRQIAAGAMLVLGYAAHSLFSSMSRKLFGSDDDVKQYVNKLRQSVGEVERDLIVFEARTKSFADQLQKNLRATITSTDKKFAEVHEIIRVKLIRDWLLESLHSCQARNIPMKFIPPQVLYTELLNLENKLQKHDVALAIPPERLWELFKLPITDCLFAETRVAITINIPIRKKGNVWKLYEIQHTKFAFNGQTCSIYPQDAHYLARTPEKAVVITPNMIPDCLIPQSTLCLVPQYTRDSSESLACAIGLLEGKSIGALRNVCAFRCSSNQELSIQEHADGAMTLTNVDSINVTCAKSSKNYTFPRIGAVYIQPSCDCSFVANGQYIIEPPLFCTPNGNSDLVVLRVTPNLWSRFENAVGLREQLFEDHSNDTVSMDWPQFVPVLNLTTPSFSPLPDAYTLGNMTYIDIWLGLLTGVVCFLTGAICCIYTVVR